MKRNIFITALITIASFLAVGYIGCTKSTDTDKCATVTCQHGGTCYKGNCTCPTGYTGSYCEKRICEANNTAQVRFSNRTGSSKTYSVLWDGSVITTLGPGAVSDYYTVAAGAHTLHFMVANSSSEACTQSTPNLAVCETMEYWCTN